MKTKPMTMLLAMLAGWINRDPKVEKASSLRIYNFWGLVKWHQ